MKILIGMLLLKKENILNISVVAPTQSCGGITWIPQYSIDGNAINLLAKGSGPIMNCPLILVKFNFSIKNLPKKEYTIIHDISINWTNIKNL
jgi:hypothetical protein